jgi:predicted CXXCH cytochrome family protein
MKKLLFLGVGSALIFTMGGIGSAQADNGPHSIVNGQYGTATLVSAEGADQCANCHRAHTAKGASQLLQAQPALCLDCHDGLGSTLNVVDGTDTTGGYLRGGGFTTAHIGTGAAAKTLSATGSRVSAQIPVDPSNDVAASVQVTSSHQINGTTTGTMWGNGNTTNGVGQTAVTLECGACHDPHGNGNYRILKPAPDGSTYTVTAAIKVGQIVNGVAATVAVPAVMSGPTPNVNIPDQSAKSYTTTNYWDVAAPTTPLTTTAAGTGNALAETAEPAGTVTDGFLGGISAWCTTCHTRYLSTGSGADTSDPIFTYKHRSDEQADFKPDCIQCHVAHGTNAQMTDAALKVTAPDGTAGVVGNAHLTTGTSMGSLGYQNSDLLRVDNRGTCLMCHSVGGPNPLAPITTP